MARLKIATALRGWPQGADPFATYRLVGNAFALVILIASIGEFVANALHPTSRDFVSFWGAAQLALAGHPAAAYDNATLHAVQASAATFSGGEMPFPYPPAYLLLVMPFGLLPFALGMAAWSLVTLGFYLFAARRLDPQSGWLAAAFPAVYANAAIGQNAFVTAGIFMAGLALLARRPFAAGLLLGCLVIKPQLALLLPVAMIAGRQWRAIGGAAISSIAILLSGAALFGPSTTLAWIHQMPLYATIARDGLVGWPKLASVYAAGRQLGLGSSAAIAVHAAVALTAAAAVWRIWRSDAKQGCKIAVLSAATMLASPYLFYYDAPILVPAFLWLARENVRPAVIAVLWCLPILAIAQIGGLGGTVNVNPVLPIALTALVAWRWWAVRTGRETPILRISQPSPVTLS